MRIRRLGWAGIEIEADGATAVVDLIEDTSPLLSLRDPGLPFPSPSARGAVDLALVTHLHHDHTDPGAVAAALGPDGVLVRPPPARGDLDEVVWTRRAEDGIVAHGLPTWITHEWEKHRAGPFRATAVPAVDGLGDPQISWIVEADGQRIFHGGDTLFHGYWWLMARRFSPIDAAFLPINGPVVDFPHLQPPSSLPAAMDPRQAAVAAHLLGARLAIPIHYDALHKPGVYTEVDKPAEAFQQQAAETAVDTRLMAPGDWIDLTEI